MKDKLYKNNHRGIYYRIKGGIFAFTLFASALAVVTIPTYIALKSVNKQATKAEEEIVEEVEDNDASEDMVFLAY